MSPNIAPIVTCLTTYNEAAYQYLFIICTIGWGLCAFVILPLLITYWVMYRQRVKAEEELANYKFSEYKEMFKVPPELNTKSTFTPVAGHQSVISPSETSRDDAFVASPPVTYRPPTNVTDSKQRWVQVK